MRTPRSWTVVAIAIALVYLVAACSSPAATSGPGTTEPTVSGAWVRPPMGADRPAAGYMTITGGSAGDALLGASSPISGDVQVHETMESAEGMGMQEVDRIEIAAGATVLLEPGGYHIMFMMPDPEALPVGGMVEITLTFENAGDIVVNAEVKAG
jgi:periplasmic copper chaperone A